MSNSNTQSEYSVKSQLSVKIQCQITTVSENTVSNHNCQSEYSVKQQPFFRIQCQITTDSQNTVSNSSRVVIWYCILINCCYLTLYSEELLLLDTVFWLTVVIWHCISLLASNERTWLSGDILVRAECLVWGTPVVSWEAPNTGISYCDEGHSTRTRT